MGIKQLIDEVIRKKLGIKDGLHVKMATVTVRAGSDDVEIEEVLFSGVRHPLDAVQEPEPSSIPGQLAAGRKPRGGGVAHGEMDIKRNPTRFPARHLAMRKSGNSGLSSAWQKRRGS